VIIIFITTFFIIRGIPLLGLNPTIKIIRISDNSLIINNAYLSEIGFGFYKYNFTSYDPKIEYVFRIDGGSSIQGSERYKVTSNRDDLLMAAKLPTSFIMGSTDGNSYNTQITAIKAVTDTIPNNLTVELAEINYKLIRLLGLSHENIVQEHVWDGSNHISSKVYIYDSKTHADLNNKVDGLINEYTLTVTYGSGLPIQHKMVSEAGD
jgi:hypothetical protein